MSSLFNTLHYDFNCPICGAKIISGIGFRVGSLTKTHYELGNTLSWREEPRRPEKRPADGNIITLGHFNCDNTRCASWQDCYPDIQSVKITIEKDKIVDVAVFADSPPQEQFAILSTLR